VSATKHRDAWVSASAHHAEAVKQKAKGLAASAVNAGGLGGGGSVCGGGCGGGGGGAAAEDQSGGGDQDR